MTHEYYNRLLVTRLNCVYVYVSSYKELSRLKRSRVKGHHVFKSESRPGDAFICAREPGNPHSPDAIVVKLGDSSGHVPDPLA